MNLCWYYPSNLLVLLSCLPTLPIHSQGNPKKKKKILISDFNRSTRGHFYMASHQYNLSSSDHGSSSPKSICPHCHERMKNVLNHRCWFHDSSKLKSKISSFYEDQKKTEKEISRIQEKLKGKKKELKKKGSSSNHGHSS